jgi:hypothetical protein
MLCMAFLRPQRTFLPDTDCVNLFSVPRDMAEFRPSSCARAKPWSSGGGGAEIAAQPGLDIFGQVQQGLQTGPLGERRRGAVPRKRRRVSQATEHLTPCPVFLREDLGGPVENILARGFASGDSSPLNRARPSAVGVRELATVGGGRQGASSIFPSEVL